MVLARVLKIAVGYAVLIQPAQNGTLNIALRVHGRQTPNKARLRAYTFTAFIIPQPLRFVYPRRT